MQPARLVETDIGVRPKFVETDIGETENAVSAARRAGGCRKAREADLAWAEHRGDVIEDRVPMSAWRQVRNLKRSLAPSAEAIAAVMGDKDKWRDAAADCLLKTSAVGRARGLAKLRQLFKPASIEVRHQGWLGEVVNVRWLEPRGPLMVTKFDAGFEQDALVSNVLSIVAFGRGVLSTGLVALEVPDHALARLFQRAPGADASRALNEAASAFLAMDAREVIGLGLERKTLVLPAAGVGFLSDVIFGKGKRDGSWRLFARPRTCLASSQLGADQKPLAPATDAGWSVLAAGFTMLGKVPGMSAPLSIEALEERLEKGSRDV